MSIGRDKTPDISNDIPIEFHKWTPEHKLKAGFKTARECLDALHTFLLACSSNGTSLIAESAIKMSLAVDAYDEMSRYLEMEHAGSHQSLLFVSEHAFPSAHDAVLSAASVILTHLRFTAHCPVPVGEKSPKNDSWVRVTVCAAKVEEYRIKIEGMSEEVTEIAGWLAPDVSTLRAWLFKELSLGLRRYNFDSLSANEPIKEEPLTAALQVDDFARWGKPGEQPAWFHQTPIEGKLEDLAKLYGFSDRKPLRPRHANRALFIVEVGKKKPYLMYVEHEREYQRLVKVAKELSQTSLNVSQRISAS